MKRRARQVPISIQRRCYPIAAASAHHDTAPHPCSGMCHTLMALAAAQDRSRLTASSTANGSLLYSSASTWRSRAAVAAHRHAGGRTSPATTPRRRDRAAVDPELIWPSVAAMSACKPWWRARSWAQPLGAELGVGGVGQQPPPAVTTGAIKWGDAIFAFAQLRRLSGHTLWPPP
jgi:hypothetical protein